MVIGRLLVLVGVLLAAAGCGGGGGGGDRPDVAPSPLAAWCSSSEQVRARLAERVDAVGLVVRVQFSFPALREQVGPLRQAVADARKVDKPPGYETVRAWREALDAAGLLAERGESVSLDTLSADAPVLSGAVRAAGDRLTEVQDRCDAA